MAWDKNDYYAAFLIIFLLAVGLTIGLWLIGAFPGQRTPKPPIPFQRIQEVIT